MNGEPEDGEYATRDDGDVRAPESPEARARTGKGAWSSSSQQFANAQFLVEDQGYLQITPVAPFSAITIEMMKKPSATIPKLSRQERPMDSMPAANCHDPELTLSTFKQWFKLCMLVLECIRYPVRYEARDAPFTRILRYRIEIFIRPGQ